MNKVQTRPVYRFLQAVKSAFLSVPVRVKIIGIMVLPVLILGLGLNYWITTGLSDWLSYLLSNERVAIAMQAGARSVLFVTVLAAFVSVLLTFILMLIFTNPLMELSQVATQVAEGDFSSRVSVQSRDEIGHVGLAVNQMLDTLTQNQVNLEKNNRRLAAINHVSLVTGRALELRQVLDAALQSTLDVMDLTTGWVYLRASTDSDDPEFTLAAAKGLDSTMTLALLPGSNGLCLCQRDLLANEIGRQANLRVCYRMRPYLGPADEETYHISIPLEARNQRFGIINLYCTEKQKPGADDLELLTSIGAHVSEVVANAWLHERLVEKEAIRQTLLEALVHAEEDERARLARELHDGAGQRLTNLMVRLKRLEKQASSDDLRKSIATLCDSVSETIEHVRGVSYRLRPAELEEFGLEVAMRSLVQSMCSDAGIEFESYLDLQGRRLPFEVESTIYRIAQESLTNIVRHSQATRVVVELQALLHVVALMIEDNGTGFDPVNPAYRDGRKRLGLLSIRERAEMQGGSLVVYSAPGEGTRVELRIPLPVENPT